VKSAWWEAANRVVELLRDPERRAAFGRRGVEVARERFSEAYHERQLNAILEDAVFLTRRVREMLRITPFARDLWAACAPGPDLLSMGRRGPAAYALYRRLMGPYTGAADGGVPLDAPLAPGQVVYLATPVAWSGEGTLAVNDLQFPFDVEVPSALAAPVRAALDALADAPVVPAGALLARTDGAGRAREALEWMLEAGIVLRASAAMAALDPAGARAAALTPLAAIHRVPTRADIVYVG
jgi:hypothetical protein